MNSWARTTQPRYIAFHEIKKVHLNKLYLPYCQVLLPRTLNQNYTFTSYLGLALSISGSSSMEVHHRLSSRDAMVSVRTRLMRDADFRNPRSRHWVGAPPLLIGGGNRHDVNLGLLRTSAHSGSLVTALWPHLLLWGGSAHDVGACGHPSDGTITMTIKHVNSLISFYIFFQKVKKKVLEKYKRPFLKQSVHNKFPATRLVQTTVV
jgi:hypothetical protein